MISKQAKKDIAELSQKIDKFKKGATPEERFKAFRLTRGVYGQRQEGVQMVRLKLPYGRITSQQLIRVADLSDKYASSNLHLTTRQNIQLHYVNVDDSPALWEGLEEVGITLREACGNTVRNITASPFAGIDPKEPFDVTLYTHAAFEYFLRNPICQDMGRKVKPAFSSSEEDYALAFIHDFGFIPRIKDGERGFKLVIGGGLGAQPFIAQTVYEFISADKIIPFMEAAIRVFDRFGEREKRHKARMKFLLDEKRGLGFKGFLVLIEEELKGLKNQSIAIDAPEVSYEMPSVAIDTSVKPVDQKAFDLWLKTNTYDQKQAGYKAVAITVPLGDIKSDKARELAAIIPQYAADDVRITINQSLMLRFVKPEALPALYNALHAIGFATAYYDTIADVTACPGTDTCNLGVSNSTAIATVLEDMVKEEYNDLIVDSDIRIKISGCMNSCGQHMIAQIGFHGSSIKKGTEIIPALQIVMGGGLTPNEKGESIPTIAEKIIKLPTRRIPDALRAILNDYLSNATEGQYFNHYYYSKGKRYFYDVLKHLAVLESIEPIDLIDWGQEEKYIQAIGVGECASVAYDMVATIIDDAKERYDFAKEDLGEGKFAQAVYHAYSANVIVAKSLLLSEDVHCNTHIGIIEDFDKHFVQTGKFEFDESFTDFVLQIKKNEPTPAFVNDYFDKTTTFLKAVDNYREKGADFEKAVISNYYNA